MNLVRLFPKMVIVLGIAFALAGLAISSYRVKAVRIGNACLWALANMPSREGMVQLHILQDKISNSSAQKKIAKSLATAVSR